MAELGYGTEDGTGATANSSPVTTDDDEDNEDEDSTSTTDAEDGSGDDDGATDEEDEEDDDSTADKLKDDSKEDPKAKDGEEEETFDGLEQLPKGLRKRVKTLFARDKEQRAAIAEKEALIAELQATPVPLVPTRANPLTDIRTPEELESRISMAKEWKSWARKNPHGGTFEQADGKSVELSEEEVQSRLDWAEAVIETAPDRKEWLATHQGAHAYAKQTYPELFKKGTPEYGVAQTILKSVPQLVLMPDYEAFMGHYIRGLKMAVEETRGVRYVKMDSKAAKSAKGATGEGETDVPAKAGIKAKPTKLPPAPAKTAPRVQPVSGGTSTQDIAALEARANAGDEDAARQLLRMEAGV